MMKVFQATESEIINEAGYLCEDMGIKNYDKFIFKVDTTQTFD